MCTSPQYVTIRTDIRFRDIRQSVLNLPAPCGKCRECLNRRRNSLAYRCYRECQACPNVYFVTLTYDDNTLPLMKTLVKVSKETGECVQVAPGEFIDRNDYKLDNYVGQFFKAKKAALHFSPDSARMPFYYDISLSEVAQYAGDEYDYFLRITPSVCPFDVRNALKRFRERWRRELDGVKPNFKYSVCFEYGPQTCRPHVHLLLWNVDFHHLKDFCEDWRRHFGFFYYEKCKSYNKDGSDGYLAVSRYLAKYMTKGRSCECASAQEGFAYCPRVLNSQNLGYNLTQNEKSYFFGFDLVGKYDKDRFEHDLSVEQVELLKKVIPERLKVHLSDKLTISLPKYFIDKLFSHKVKVYDYEKRSIVEKVSKYRIWHLVSQFIQDSISADLEQKYRELYFYSQRFGRPYYEVCAEFEDSKALSLQSRNEAAEKAYISSLSKSLF